MKNLKREKNTMKRSASQVIAVAEERLLQVGLRNVDTGGGFVSFVFFVVPFGKPLSRLRFSLLLASLHDGCRGI